MIRLSRIEARLSKTGAEVEELYRNKSPVELNMMVNHMLENEEATCNRAQMYENKDRNDVRTAPCCDSCDFIKLVYMIREASRWKEIYKN